MANRLCWQIYYADESVVTGKTFDDWLAAADEGIIVVREIYDKDVSRKRPVHTIQTYAGDDYYWMTPNSEISAGAAKYIPSDALVKSGQLVSDELYSQIHNKASIPPKYGEI